jgi:hypothetical protein
MKVFWRAFRPAEPSRSRFFIGHDCYDPLDIIAPRHVNEFFCAIFRRRSENVNELGLIRANPLFAPDWSFSVPEGRARRVSHVAIVLGLL